MHSKRLSALTLLAGVLLAGCQSEIQFDKVSDADFIQEQTEIVQADASALIEATKSEDIDGILALTHPQVIEFLGGKADAHNTMQQLFKELRSLQMSYDTFEQKGKPTFYRTDRHDIAIQKMYSICTTPEVSFEQNSALIAMREIGGAKWKYMDYNTETEKAVYKILTELPKKLELPKPTMEIDYK